MTQFRFQLLILDYNFKKIHISQITVTLQKWWMSHLGNAMARNMKIQPGINPYGFVLVQSAQHLQKNVIPSL